MHIQQVLVCDDEPLIRNFLKTTLERKGKKVTLATDGQEGIECLKQAKFDLVITDMKMPNNTGIDVLKFAKKAHRDTIVILITAMGIIEDAIEATRHGAFNYLIKPFSPESIETLVDKAEEHQHLLSENQYLRKAISFSSPHTCLDILLKSPSMKKILSEIDKIANSTASVFISGESGCGKEVIAQAIHHRSKRAQFPFIKVNCAAIPESLIESEFFGHEKGAFTGASGKRIGRFELADKGSLLLDEVTEIPLNLQPKLLRAIQEQEFERLGGTSSIKVDTRFIATSNRNMKEAIQDKVFREDLYYRLNVMPIDIPPLRKRKEDILSLGNFFLQQFCEQNHRTKKTFSKQAEEKLINYPWPGNVRELANIMERVVVLDFSNIVEKEHLYLDMSTSTTEKQASKTQNIDTDLPLKEIERIHILKTLKSYSYNRTKTAKVLGISLRTLRNKIQEYGVK